jgi:PAS domain S-box-containing protein
MQNDLKALEQRWGLALQSASFGVWDLDPQAHVVHYSPEWKTMLGYGPDDASDPTAVWRSRVHPEDLDGMRARLDAHLSGQAEAYACEFRLRAADGRYRWVLSRGRVVARDGEGRALRVVGTLTDITDRRELEAVRAERDRAEAANRAKTEFLSRMSHELRTPLNAVLGFAQLLQQRLGSDDLDAQRRYLGHIEQAGWHLLAMINDVLDLARVESGQLAMHLQPLPLAQAWQDSQAMLAPLAAEQGVQLLPAALPAGATVLADPVRLKQVLSNLLSNAVKYNRRGGTVQLRAQAQGKGWQLQLQDTGQGIAADQMVHLFEPFNRLGRRARHADGGAGVEGVAGVDGVGIGLVLTRWLVQRMGGDIQVTSQEGQGTTVTLLLPAAPAAPAAQP